jgi:hypothetical protein
LEHTSPFIWGFALSTDGKLIATCALVPGKGHQLTVHSASDFEVVTTLRLKEAGHVTEICWSPDGQELAVVRRDGFLFYRYPDFTLTGKFGLKYAADIAYSRSGEYVALSDWECGMLVDRKVIPSAT